MITMPTTTHREGLLCYTESTLTATAHGEPPSFVHPEPDPDKIGLTKFEA